MELKPEQPHFRQTSGLAKGPKSKGPNGDKTTSQSPVEPHESISLGNSAPLLGSAIELNALNLQAQVPKLGSAKELNAVPTDSNAPKLGSALELNKVPDPPAGGFPELTATRGDLAPLNLAGFEVSDSVGANALSDQTSAPIALDSTSLPHEQKGFADFSKVLQNAVSEAESKDIQTKETFRAERVDHTWEPAPSSGPLKGILRASRQIGNAFASIVGGGDPAFHLKEEQQHILALESKYSAKDPATGEFLIPDLSVKTAEFRELLKSGEATLDDIRADAYAVAREASARTLGMRHYPCQVLGGLAMDQGSIAEMMTGEGKTLTAVLPLYLNALACDENGKSKGAHLITVNDTLAERDGEEMRPVFESLGMTLGVVTEGKTPEEKREAYQSDITYATNNAIGFDYLRDQMVKRPEDRVQRDLHYALVDEVDMVLIDEASTPLILSVGDSGGDSDYRNFNRLVQGLRTDGSDFHLSNKEKTISLTAEGLQYVETHLGFQEAREKALNSDVELKVQTELLGEMRADQTKATEGRAALTAFQEDVEDPKALAKFQKYVKDGGFEFLSKEDQRRIAREGPRPDDLRGLNDAIDLQLELNRTLLPGAEADVKNATAEANQAKADLTASSVALEKLRAWRGAEPGPEADKLKDDYQKAYDAAPEYNVYAEENMHRVNLMDNALKSNYLFHEGEDYLVLDGEVKIVDQFKGRTPAGRRYSHGLHQALEAKENVVVKAPTRTSASITYPNLFKLYSGSPEMRNEPGLTNGLAGMSGTAVSEAREFQEFYGTNVVPIPTNKPVILKKNETLYFTDQEAKVAALVNRAEELFKAGKPVLIGTVSVEDNEYVAGQLAKRGIPCQVLNAKSVKGQNAEENAQIARESEMIKHAGNSGMVTVATNMAGRGINIKPDWIAHSKLSRDVMRDAQPLGQMATRIEKLAEAGKGAEIFVGNAENAQGVASYFQGEGVEATADPERPGYVVTGSSDRRETLDFKDFPPKPAVVDVKDEKELKKLRYWFDLSNAPVQVVHGAAEAPPAGTVQIRVLDTDKSRKDPASYENPEPRAPVPDGVLYFPAENYFTGGLHILATEAHDSPRIDRQLIGRAGRQGAPGEYQFFLSLQDRVLKFFGGERLEKDFDKMAKSAGVDPANGVSSAQLDKLVKKAQGKVGNLQFDQRSRSNDFDKTNDDQRQVFYHVRADIVDSENVKPLLQDWTTFHFTDEVLQSLPGKLLGGYKPEQVDTAISKASEKLGFDFPIDLKLDQSIKKDELKQRLTSYLNGLFVESDLNHDKVRDVLLSSADDAWSNHLDFLDILQTSIQWESIAQQDPKLQYKLRAGEAFNEFISILEQNSIRDAVAPALKMAAQKPAFFGMREPLLAEPVTRADSPTLTTTKQGERLDPEPIDFADAARERAIEREMLPAESRYWPEEQQIEAISKLPTEELFYSLQEPAVDGEGKPLNPNGATGKTGRGEFSRFGANVRAVPVILKRNPETQELQLLTKGGELPDGEVELGQATPNWLLTSLFPAQGENPRAAFRARDQFAARVEQSDNLFSGGVEHPENRDNAWWEAHSQTVEMDPNFELPQESGLEWKTVSASLLESQDPWSRSLIARSVESYQENTNFRVATDGTVGRTF